MKKLGKSSASIFFTLFHPTWNFSHIWQQRKDGCDWEIINSRHICALIKLCKFLLSRSDMRDSSWRRWLVRAILGTPIRMTQRWIGSSSSFFCDKRRRMRKKLTNCATCVHIAHSWVGQRIIWSEIGRWARRWKKDQGKVPKQKSINEVNRFFRRHRQWVKKSIWIRIPAHPRSPRGFWKSAHLQPGRLPSRWLHVQRAQWKKVELWNAKVNSRRISHGFPASQINSSSSFSSTVPISSSSIQLSFLTHLQLTALPSNLNLRSLFSCGAGCLLWLNLRSARLKGNCKIN